MSHEISHANKFGLPEFACVGKPAWHGLGTVLADAPNSLTMAEAARLNWQVEKHPLPNPLQPGQFLPDNVGTFRMDTGACLGIVTDRYSIVQNAEAFAALDGLTETGMMRYESAGALFGGRVVFALGRLPSLGSDDFVAEGDSLLRYILCSTNHDGSGGFHLIPTSVRVVCANTHRLAVGNLKGIKHVGDMDAKIRIAQQWIVSLDAAFKGYRDNARTLGTRTVTADDAHDYVESLYPAPTPDAEGNISKSGQTRHDNIVGQIMRNFKAAGEVVPAIAGSWWALYNAVTEYVDHQATFQGEGQSRDENRMESLTNGRGADFKDRAFALATDMTGLSSKAKADDVTSL